MTLVGVSETQWITTTPEGDLHIELPGGCFHYRDSSHRYATCSGPREHIRGKFPSLMGTSTPVKVMDLDKRPLLKWAARNTAFLALRAEDERVRAVREPRALWDVLKQLKLTHEEISDTAQTTGTDMHKVFECFVQGEPLPRTQESEQGYVAAIGEWLEHAQPEVLNVEQFVLSKTHGFAGRFDLRYRNRDGAIVLADLKTSESGFVPLSYHYQLPGYELAAKECGVGASDVRLILQIRPEGTWREIRARGTEGGFLDALAAYKTASKLKAELDREWRQKRAQERSAA